MVWAVIADLLRRHDLGGAELRHCRPPLRVTDAGDHMRTGDSRELHGGSADAAGGAGDQHALADCKTGLSEECVEGGEEDLGEATRFCPRESGRHCERMPLRHRRQSRLSAAADERHDPVAGCVSGHAATRAQHFSGKLQTGDVLRIPGRRRVQAPGLSQVGAIDPGGAHRHQQFVVRRNGIRSLPPGNAAPLDNDREHHVLLDAGALPARLRVASPHSIFGPSAVQAKRNNQTRPRRTS